MGWIPTAPLHGTILCAPGLRGGGPAGYDCEALARMHTCNHREHGQGITAMCAKSCGTCSTSCGASTAATATDADDDDGTSNTGGIVRTPRAFEAGAVAPLCRCAACRATATLAAPVATVYVQQSHTVGLRVWCWVDCRAHVYYQVLGQNAGSKDWPSFVSLWSTTTTSAYIVLTETTTTSCGASLIAHDKILTVTSHATNEDRVYVCGERWWALVSAARARSHTW